MTFEQIEEEVLEMIHQLRESGDFADGELCQVYVNCTGSVLQALSEDPIELPSRVPVVAMGVGDDQEREDAPSETRTIDGVETTVWVVRNEL